MAHWPEAAHVALAFGRLHGSHEAVAQPVCVESTETHLPPHSFAQVPPEPPTAPAPPAPALPPDPSPLVEPPHADAANNTPNAIHFRTGRV